MGPCGIFLAPARSHSSSGPISLAARVFCRAGDFFPRRGRRSAVVARFSFVPNSCGAFCFQRHFRPHFFAASAPEACVRGASNTPRIGKVLGATFGLALFVNLLSWPNPLAGESKSILTDLVPLVLYWLVDGASAVMLGWIVRNRVARSHFLNSCLLLSCLLVESWC